MPTNLPPSLAVSPNIPVHHQTVRELKLERDYWQSKIDAATGWSAAVGAAAEFRDDCVNELKRRGVGPSAPSDCPGTTDGEVLSSSGGFAPKPFQGNET